MLKGDVTEALIHCTIREPAFQSVSIRQRPRNFRFAAHRPVPKRLVLIFNMIVGGCCTVPCKGRSCFAWRKCQRSASQHWKMNAYPFKFAAEASRPCCTPSVSFGWTAWTCADGATTFVRSLAESPLSLKYEIITKDGTGKATV